MHTYSLGGGNFRELLNTHTFAHAFNGPFPGLPQWAGTSEVKPVWILLKQETVSGSGVSWAVCKSAPCSRQIIIIIIIVHEYYYGGAVALLLQDHLTMSVSRFAG